MNRKKISLILAALLSSVIAMSVIAKVDNGPKISGEVVDGLRHLQLVPGQANDFVVYRGDYIQPSINGSSHFVMEIPELKIDKKFPAKEGEKPYIKMKKAGNYNFNVGSINGTIKVIEYEAISYTELNAEQAQKILKDNNPLILDVRTQGEFMRGYIQGAKLLPVQIFQQNIHKLENYRNRDVLIYCATGNRSTVASRLLIESGFKNVYNLRYGISDWAKRGYSVTR